MERRRGQSKDDWELRRIELQRIRGATHYFWAVTGRQFDQTFCSALSVVEPLFWGSNRFPPLFPSLWENDALPTVYVIFYFLSRYTRAEGPWQQR